MLNEHGVRLLHWNQPNSAVTIFLYCQDLLYGNRSENHRNQQVLIYNHLGCCYRKLNDLQNAKKYLHLALELAKSNRGLTLLNLCAIYSQLGK